MPVVWFHRSALAAQRWKNGGGVTREVLCVPQGSDYASFDWRVSIAHIARSGPFSPFPGVDRVITLLDGGGMHLRSGDGAVDHLLDAPLEPFAFTGESPVQCELLGGDCHDFNVMTRRDACTARVQVLREAAALPACGQGLLMVARGAWTVQGEETLRLAAGEGVWWQDGERAWRVGPAEQGSALLAVAIEAK